MSQKFTHNFLRNSDDTQKPNDKQSKAKNKSMAEMTESNTSYTSYTGWKTQTYKIKKHRNSTKLHAVHNEKKNSKHKSVIEIYASAIEG